MTRLLFPGAVSYDYSVAFEKSAPADGKVAITATLGNDVDKVKYAFFEGCAQRVARCGQIGRHRRRDDPERGDHGFGYESSAVMEKTGIYTIVGNSYDEKATSRNTGTYRSVTSRPARRNPS